MTELHIPLPWNSPELSPNRRIHWRKRASITADLRRRAGWLLTAERKIAGNPTPSHLTVGLGYRPRDNRRRDADNLVMDLKAACDALVDAGWVPDDTPTYMSKRMPEIHPAGKGEPELLWIELTWKDQQ